MFHHFCSAKNVICPDITVIINWALQISDIYISLFYSVVLRGTKFACFILWFYVALMMVPCVRKENVF